MDADKAASETVTVNHCPNCERLAFRTGISELFILFGIFTIACVLIALTLDRRIQALS